MIEDIEINNFRCFDRLKVSECKRINLISGKNNVGKTTLLEAILLNSNPTAATIISLVTLRRESDSFRKTLPGRMWNNLFFQQEVNCICSINSCFQDKTFKKVELLVRNKKDFFDKVFEKMFGEIPSKEIEVYKEWLEKEELTNSEETNAMFVRVNANEIHFASIITPSRNREINLQDTPRKGSNNLYTQNSSFIPSSLISSNVSLTEEFDKARLNEKEDNVLKAFQIIDSSIIAVESFSIPEPTIYLKRQGEKRLPLSLFGDAMNRIADIILKIINNQDSVLLIDEIENGIHHSNQIAFWDFLYKLAEQLNVQIFATTHSLEMTEAFIKAGIDRQDSAAHFELTRHEKTNKIVAINRDLETLEYGISHHKEVRGGT
jgi:AAA15 family ATPase/GTPase